MITPLTDNPAKRVNKVTILDSKDIANPESRAVLQAMASRSVVHIDDLKDRVNQDKTEKFIDMNCISYGHDSVLENADSLIINLHGISMLAAKAIEDTSKFKGTEASTRYIDITSLPYHIGNIPYSHSEYKKRHALMQKQFDFFKTNYPLVQSWMQERFPVDFIASINKNNDFNKTVYEKAINAKSFDVMRSFLPPGASTIVNWTTDIRTLKDRLTELLGHHLLDVKYIALSILQLAVERYPSSFKNFPDKDVIAHISKYALEYHAFEENANYGPETIWRDPELQYQDFDIAYTPDEIDEIKQNYPSLASRPRGAPLPRIYASRFNVSGLMDFGSFRDIQRHRNGLCKISILNELFGFEKWYLEQLPPNVRKIADDHLYEIEQEIADIEPLDRQYFIPFGYRMPYVLDYSLEQMIYVAELRSSRHVHPTCRVVAQGTSRFLDEKFPFIKIYPDRSMSDFDIRRGQHDINFAQTN